MHVIDKRMRHIGMKRRVDRGGARIEVEGAMGQIVHHLIFMVEAAVQFLQCTELFHVERGKAVALDRGAVTARAFDPQHLDLFARERIFLPDLGGGVAAAVVGDTLVGAEEVGPVHQPVRFAHRIGFGFVPEVGKGGGRLFAHVCLFMWR